MARQKWSCTQLWNAAVVFWSQLPSIPVSQVLPPEASFLAPIQL